MPSSIASVTTAIATAHTNIEMIEAYQHWVLSTLRPGAERSPTRS